MKILRRMKSRFNIINMRRNETIRGVVIIADIMRLRTKRIKTVLLKPDRAPAAPER